MLGQICRLGATKRPFQRYTEVMRMRRRTIEGSAKLNSNLRGKSRTFACMNCRGDPRFEEELLRLEFKEKELDFYRRRKAVESQEHELRNMSRKIFGILWIFGQVVSGTCLRKLWTKFCKLQVAILVDTAVLRLNWMSLWTPATIKPSMIKSPQYWRKILNPTIKSTKWLSLSVWLKPGALS